MTRYALRYPVKPGSADELAAAIAAGGDPQPPPGVPTKLRATSVFRRGEDIVRVMDIDGTLDEAIEVLAGSPAIQAMGRQLRGLLTKEYDLATPAGVRRFFSDNLMTTVTERAADDAELVAP